MAEWLPRAVGGGCGAEDDAGVGRELSGAMTRRTVYNFASMSGTLDLSRDEKAKHFYVQMAPMGTA